MKALVVFVLLMNAEGGKQEEVYKSEPIAFEQCDKMQQAVWATEFPAVEIDELGPVPMVDAACVLS